MNSIFYPISLLKVRHAPNISLKQDQEVI
jgi:hypothetical protein